MLDSSAAATTDKTYSCNRPEKLSSRFLGQLISGDLDTYSKMATIFNTIEVFQGSAMLHGKNNSRLFFPWEKMLSLMKNIFIVPAMQHGIHANRPLR